MSARDAYRAELRALIDTALVSPGLLPPNEFNLTRYSLNAFTRNRLLDPDIGALEDYLIDHSDLPGMNSPSNFSLLDAFGDVVRDVCTSEETPLRVGFQNMAWLLSWLNIRHTPSFFGEDPDSPLQILQMAAAVGIGEWSSIFNHIESGVSTLFTLANSPLWRVRESAAAGLRRMADAAWNSTLRRLSLQAPNSHEWWLIAMGLADVDLLESNIDRVIDTFNIYQQALLYIGRNEEASPTLLAAFGQVLAVPVQVQPSMGFQQLRVWATWPQEEVKAVIRNNLDALSPWPNEVAAIRALL